MKYRPEIDGLRAVAVIPVVLFHAGFDKFAGGFLGVDIFFVISGYLITTLIVREISEGNFTLKDFYERRARRILPALFLVMMSTAVAGYFVLMPDEYKNLGQSLVAATLFSNNILLGITSGYWDLASEFKPLLHTWSLGVEEQFYLVFPILMLSLWRYIRTHVAWIILILAAISYITFYLLNITSPRWAFYILPTRAWELLIGAIAAFIVLSDSKHAVGLCRSPLAAYFGVFAIAFAMVMCNTETNELGYYNVVATIGTMLIIVSTVSHSYLREILSSRALVFVGLISYSLYLWHQPVYSFVRAFSANRPDAVDYLMALAVASLLSILTWKFVETPFRDRRRIRSRSFIFLASISSILLIIFGIILNKTYGLPERAFGTDIRAEDMDKRIYNERVYKFKKSEFKNQADKKILVMGTSFARDFVNIIVETFDLYGVDIVYRDDLQECMRTRNNTLGRKLFSSANVIVFAGGGYDANCLDEDLAYTKSNGKEIFYVGFKDFGYNLNWLLRQGPIGRANRYNKISSELIAIDEEIARNIPTDKYISMISPVILNEAMPITDEDGNMLSTDRAHLTKYGALFFGKNVVRKTEFAKDLEPLNSLD